LGTNAKNQWFVVRDPRYSGIAPHPWKYGIGLDPGSLSLSLSLREFRLEIPKGRILIWKVEDSLLGWDSGSVPRSMEESDVTLRRKRYLLLTVVEPDNCHWRGR
jgi:hypothetical protein